MDRRVPVAVAALLVLTAGGVQLADLPIDDPSPPRVDFTEPPAQVAADSAARFSAVDYAYRLDIADDPKGPWQQVRVARISHDDRRYRKAGPLGNRGMVLFGNDAIAFARAGRSNRWKPVTRPATAYPVPAVSQPFLVDKIERAPASVAAQNQSMVVIDIDTVSLKFADGLQGNATLFIDKGSGAISHAIVAVRVSPQRVRYLRFQLTDTDPVVTRPETIPLSPRELLWDVLRGPLFET